MSEYDFCSEDGSCTEDEDDHVSLAPEFVLIRKTNEKDEKDKSYAEVLEELIIGVEITIRTYYSLCNVPCNKMLIATNLLRYSLKNEDKKTMKKRFGLFMNEATDYLELLRNNIEEHSYIEFCNYFRNIYNFKDDIIEEYSCIYQNC